jgi:hypothetical protein
MPFCRYFFNIKEAGCIQTDLWRAFVEFRHVMRYRTNAPTMSVTTTFTVGYDNAIVSGSCRTLPAALAAAYCCMENSGGRPPSVRSMLRSMCYTLLQHQDASSLPLPCEAAAVLLLLLLVLLCSTVAHGVDCSDSCVVQCRTLHAGWRLRSCRGDPVQSCCVLALLTKCICAVTCACRPVYSTSHTCSLYGLGSHAEATTGGCK